jgi:tRNA pseudouridine55 synthase
LLPLCFGEATKFAQVLLDARKEYIASIHFGIATATGDAEGDVVATGPVELARADIERALPRFLGTIAQLPPRHSALKFEGRNYYQYARAGIEIPRAPRDVEIDAIVLLEWASPVATLRVTCGKGTYIRVLAEDLGAVLGSCAHLIALRRTATGPFALDGAVTLETLEAMDDAGRDALLLPAHAPLTGMPRLIVDAQVAQGLAEGRIGPAPHGAAGRYCCFAAAGAFVGVVEVDAIGMRAVRLVRATGG